MIQIKNAKELDGMRRANALSAAALKYEIYTDGAHPCRFLSKF